MVSPSIKTSNETAVRTTSAAPLLQNTPVLFCPAPQLYPLECCTKVLGTLTAFCVAVSGGSRESQAGGQREVDQLPQLAQTSLVLAFQVLHLGKLLSPRQTVTIAQPTKE